MEKLIKILLFVAITLPVTAALTACDTEGPIEGDSIKENPIEGDKATTQYITSYQIDGVTYKMIRVDAPSDAPFRSFYMMETELPLNKNVRFGEHWISQLDDGNQIVFKYEMKSFINELRDKTNLPFRLPTKSEWQFAAAGGMQSENYKYAGGDVLDYVGWYKYNSGNQINDFCQKKPNELGFYDMSGNYAELCNDSGDIYYVDGPFCGGSYKDAADDCTIKSFKNGLTSGKVAGTEYQERDAVDAHYIGLRLVYGIVSELESDVKPNTQAKTDSYYIGNQKHKMIYVEAPKNSKFKSFYMMETELPINVTTSYDNYTWLNVIDTNADCIVIKAEFRAYLEKVRELTKLPFRLPTLDEWQYAAAGGLKSMNYKYAGGNVLDQVGWYKDNSGGVAQSLSKKQPNELGFYDMSGNFAELCNETGDVYNVDGPYCGGSYKDTASDCLITSWKSGITKGTVSGVKPTIQEADAVDTRFIGFRLVYTADE